MQNRKLAKICAVALAGSMILSSAGFAASAAASASSAKAATSSSITSTTSPTLFKFKQALFGKNYGKAKGKAKAKPFKAAMLTAGLKAAVDAKIITQAESDQIKAFIANSKKAEKKELFKELVAKGILTQAKADALKASFKTQWELKRQEGLKTEIGRFVTDKTITQEQADEIMAAIKAAGEERKAAFEKAKTMSKADAKAYLDNFRKTEVKPLDSLVADATITQEQADKIGKVIHQGRDHVGANGHRDD